MPKLGQPSNRKNLSIITQPWFVIILVCSCFAILTPKIFLPLFMQITGFNKPEPKNDPFNPSRPPNMPNPRGSPHGPGGARPNPHGSGPRPPPGSFNPNYQQQTTTGSSSKGSLLTYLLPVYAIGKFC